MFVKSVPNTTHRSSKEAPKLSVLRHGYHLLHDRQPSLINAGGADQQYKPVAASAMKEMW